MSRKSFLKDSAVKAGEPQEFCEAAKRRDLADEHVEDFARGLNVFSSDAARSACRGLLLRVACRAPSIVFDGEKKRTPRDLHRFSDARMANG